MSNVSFTSRPRLTPMQLDMLRVMSEHWAFLRTDDVAVKTNVSESSARQRLNRLHARGFVDVQQQGRSLEWRINDPGRAAVREWES